MGLETTFLFLGGEGFFLRGKLLVLREKQFHSLRTQEGGKDTVNCTAGVTSSTSSVTRHVVRESLEESQEILTGALIIKGINPLKTKMTNGKQPLLVGDISSNCCFSIRDTSSNGCSSIVILVCGRVVCRTKPTTWCTKHPWIFRWLFHGKIGVSPCSSIKRHGWLYGTMQ